MLTLRNPSWRQKPRDWQAEAYKAVRRHMLDAKPTPAVISAIMGAGKSLLLEEICAGIELPKGQKIVVSSSTQRLVEDLYRNISARCGAGRSVGIWYGRRKRLGDVIVTCVPSAARLAEKLRQGGATVALWIADECHRTECATVLEAYDVLKPLHSLGLTATPFRSDKFEAITLFEKLIYRYGVKEAQSDGVVVPWRIVNCRDMFEDLDNACEGMINLSRGPGLANATDIEDAESFAEFLTKREIPSKAIHSKVTPAEQAKIMRDLQRGEIRCAVHVNLLTEGANFPFLRWLLLRRQVDSRVRFIQEIGRLLRSHPGKSEAIFYDPHDLFGTFALTYGEALGDPPERPVKDCQQITPEEYQRGINDPDPAVAMAWIESAIRALVVAADAAGYLGPRKPMKTGERLKPSTALQGVALQRSIKGVETIAPDEWFSIIRQIQDKPKLLRFGFAADLITSLSQIDKHGKWPPIDAEGRISAAIGDKPEAPKDENFLKLGEGNQVEVNFLKLIGDQA